MKKIKLAGAIVETVLSIPVLGWLIYVYSFGLFAIAEITLGIIGLTSHNAKGKNVGSILQILAGCLGWVPIIGFALHVLSAIFLYKEKK